MNSKNILLDKFRENQTNRIDASDLRIFVEAVYNELLLVEDVIDRSDILDERKVASLKQVTEIRMAVDALTSKVELMIPGFAKASDVYTKPESDFKFLDKTEADQKYTTKQDTYSKSETVAAFYKKEDVDAKIAALELRIQNLEGQ